MMRNIFYLGIATVLLMGWSFRTKTFSQGIVFQPHYLTKVEAEKILGQKAQLTDSASYNEENIATFKSTYTADSKDPNTGKLGAIYFMVEQYKEIASAKETYASFKASNRNSAGFEILNDLGDEAWLHSDGENFYLIIVRKGEKMFRMKVNKVTSKTSMEAFRQVAKVITDRM
jgi:hypothetical protein